MLAPGKGEPMPVLRLLFVPTVLITLLLTGCPEKECAAGATQACLCAGAESGAQVCNDDGMGWGPCDCAQSDDDDDDTLPGDDDDDDATPGDDDDDDATPGDDDDATPGDDDDDDTTAGDDDDSEPCCSDCDYPAYVVDSISLVTFLESDTYNEFLDLLLADALPPTYDSVIILLDPDQDLTGVSSFNARFGVGVVDQDLYSFGGVTYVDWPYSQDGSYNFATTGTGQMLNLSFGVSVPVYEAGITGTFSATYDAITTGSITGAIQETDTESIETSFGNLHDLMDGRTLDVDLDGDGTMDSWTFEMAFTAYQFL